MANQVEIRLTVMSAGNLAVREPGDTIKVTPAEAQRRIAAGHAVMVKTTRTKASKPKPRNPKPITQNR